MANTMRIRLMDGSKKIAERDVEQRSANRYVIYETKIYRLSKQTPPSSLNGFNGNATYRPIRDIMYWDTPLGADTPCGKCDECEAGIRCRELPAKER